MKLYLGNLNKSMTSEQLKEVMLPYGTPQSAEIATDRSSGASKGFGFVEFATDAEAQAAIAGLDGKEVHGQTIKCNESRPKNASH
jgi:cold-inducible RNA-binding protein